MVASIYERNALGIVLSSKIGEIPLTGAIIVQQFSTTNSTGKLNLDSGTFYYNATIVPQNRFCVVVLLLEQYFFLRVEDQDLSYQIFELEDSGLPQQGVLPISA